VFVIKPVEQVPFILFLIRTFSLTCRAQNVDRIDGRFHGKVKALVLPI
jgi:hypothetical protein